MKKLQSRCDDWDFIFCAGDDKTDEDMFKALKHKRMTTSGSSLVSYTSDNGAEAGEVLNGAETANENTPDIFTCTIGPAGKKTAASWHVEQPSELISLLTDFSKLT